MTESTRPKCGNCKRIGGHAWGLTDEERECLKWRERVDAFQAAATRSGLDYVDRFRFSPRRGVLPYSSAHNCKFYAPDETKAMMEGKG